jgi:hypothetical protein
MNEGTPKPPLVVPEPDAIDGLRELASETLEQDDPEDSSGNLVISALAMLGAAAMVGVVGWFLIQGGMSEGAAGLASTDHHGHTHGHRNSEADSLWFLLIAGYGAMFVAAVLVLFALISLAKLAMRKLNAGG